MDRFTARFIDVSAITCSELVKVPLPGSASCIESNRYRAKPGEACSRREGVLCMMKDMENILHSGLTILQLPEGKCDVKSRA
ncbi:hypothetical protein G9409_10550 [Chlorobium sp. BLA1]|uniref:hypothetical protein n=1 Tax=Candidatus Chlorobium masyuteum TaxID=2716876 RepID=UPI0014214667|nr:hypothetical protein [Candidatus Chlorobium masyuteum]NHQ61013.1 hypothetical protein [Candidatus Chlorobium masyuteum]